MVTQKNANSENKQCICRNTKIVTVDNEIICGGCGQVFGYEDYQERASVSKVNLYLRTESGGRKVNIPTSTKKLHIHNTDNGKISDICDKISINYAMQCDVLQIYNNVLKMKFPKAVSACFAIYYVCRTNKFPFEESKVRDIVCMTFGVQNAPTMLNAIIKVNKAADMSSNAWFAQNVNCKNKKMPTTTEANPPEFYLHRQVQQFCARHPDVSFNFLCRTATEFFKNMDHQGNSELRARIAIKVAIRMCVPK